VLAAIAPRINSVHSRCNCCCAHSWCCVLCGGVRVRVSSTRLLTAAHANVHVRV
jgi:hypothetical protein